MSTTNSIDLDHGTVSARLVAPGRARVVYTQPESAWGSDSPASIRDAAQRLLGVELAPLSGEWSRTEGDGEVAQDVEVLGAQEVECAYCGAMHTPPETVPALDDDAAWSALADDHDSNCEWVLTRAHRFDACLKIDQEYGPEAWWDAARATVKTQTPAVRALFERIEESGSSFSEVYCRAQDAKALVAWASKLPDWRAGDYTALIVEAD